MSPASRPPRRWVNAKAVTITLGCIAAIVILWLVVELVHRKKESDPERIISILPQGPVRKGTVMVKEGEIPVKDLLALLASITDCEILVSSAISEKRISIAATVRDANEELIKAILEIYGIRLFVDDAARDHGRIMRVEHYQSGLP